MSVFNKFIKDEKEILFMGRMHESSRDQIAAKDSPPEYNSPQRSDPRRQQLVHDIRIHERELVRAYEKAVCECEK